MILAPSRILDTITAWRIALMISILYPPAISVPRPTFTPHCRASRNRKGLAEKYAFDWGQCATAVPVWASCSSEGGSKNVQWACTVRGVSSLLWNDYKIRKTAREEHTYIECHTLVNISMSSTPRSRFTQSISSCASAMWLCTRKFPFIARSPKPFKSSFEHVGTNRGVRTGSTRRWC